ncbi:hypothetical protein [Nitratireductor sp. StC3]|uniref:hypothetical protein n=1 Tax=Nitratireductor sp. StC3 TaxID=2126741 RepID=UPI000D0D6D0A|nr:hypothetical protein [Nitratireductor sp. StC3]PSM16294.1 hypothetical protein C7T96_20860 [Nitratireductor sp. StC3]
MSLTHRQRHLLQAALRDRLMAVCYGAGVDSTAMLVALKQAGLRPDIITFADLSAEKPPTLEHLDRMDRVLAEWSWPAIVRCRKETLPGTGYSDLYGNCIANETLPSLAFGLKSCSIKWKQKPQDHAIKGARSGPNAAPPHPVWTEAQRRGVRIVKLIGYDCGRADLRRSRNLPEADADFDYAYPLQILGWNRTDCVRAITDALGVDMVPIKSACFFCPASKVWELYWLAAHHPDLLERALILERNALTGRHSRFDEVEFGGSWDELVRTADRFPSTSTTVGLGRSFAWNQWARVNGVVDDAFRVKRGVDDRARFRAMANQLRGEDNALYVRSVA